MNKIFLKAYLIKIIKRSFLMKCFFKFFVVNMRMQKFKCANKIS